MATPKRKALGNAVDKLAELGFDPIEAMVANTRNCLLRSKDKKAYLLVQLWCYVKTANPKRTMLDIT